MKQTDESQFESSAPLFKRSRNKLDSESKSRISEPSHEPNVKGEKEIDLASYSLDYQLTARFRYSELTRRDASLLLDILNYQSVYFGVTFAMYLSIDMLFVYLVGNKSSVYEIKDEKERQTCWVSELILRDLDGEFISLGDKMLLRERTKQKLIQNNLLLSKRVYGSRFVHFKPEKFIEVRAVPLNIFLERSKTSIPYSSYTKGYGEGSGSAHTSKTRFSAELDGAEENPLKFSLKNLPKFLSIILIEEFQKMKKKQEKK